VPIIVPDLGELELVRRMLRPHEDDALPLRLRLFANDYVPNRVTEIDDVTEATFAGYVQKDLDPAGWASPVNVGGVAQMVWAAGFLSWLASAGSQTCYGYYVTDNPAEVLLWAERFPIPLAVSTTVPAIVLPIMRLHSEFEPDP
jgi:hypothetical protein